MPNVLIFHTDQQRWDSLGCYGNTFARTPHVDALAAAGTVFERHITANPICMPSRASFFCGLQPPGHNVWTNGVALNRREYCPIEANSGEQIVEQPVTMADLFAAAGYDTVALGKVHLTPNRAPIECGYPEHWASWVDGRWDDWNGPYYGFRHYESTQGHGESVVRAGHYAKWLESVAPEVRQQVIAGEGRVRPIPHQGDLYPSSLPYELHNSHWLAERACAYLTTERPADQPFFLFVGFPDPHHPFTPCHDILPEFESVDVPEPTDVAGAGIDGGPAEPWCQHRLSEHTPEQVRTVLRYTAAMVHQIDRAVGQVTDCLKSTGLWDDTIVVYTSDHGDFQGDHSRLYKGFAPSRCLNQTPLVVRAPGAGLPERVALPVSNTDVLPTLAGLCGVAPPTHVDGEDVTQLVGQSDRTVFGVSSGGPRESLNYLAVDGRYRYTWYPEVDGHELFDHEEDPAEVRNVAGARPGVAARLRAAICERLPHWHHPILGRVGLW